MYSTLRVQRYALEASEVVITCLFALMEVMMMVVSISQAADSPLSESEILHMVSDIVFISRALFLLCYWFTNAHSV